MRAEIIAIGTELLIGHVANTNAQYLSEELNTCGISVLYHSVVGDNLERIQDALDIAAQRADLIICTGGLGPTVDDLTHEAIADYLRVDLVMNTEQADIIRSKYQSRKIPEINYKQARVIEGAKIIANPQGTAIGFLCELKAQAQTSRRALAQNLVLMSFPGVPIEMQSMFQATAKPYLLDLLRTQNREAVIVSRKIHMMGISESAMAQIIQDAAPTLFTNANPSVAPYAVLGECYLRVTARAKTEHLARNMIQITQMQVAALLEEYIYAYDDESLPEVLGRRLIDKGWTIAFAESCTGGLLSKLMTDIPGASQHSKLNLVTYSNEAKEQLLSVRAETLRDYGAVSTETALEMLEGLSKISGADINVAVTGILGPSGASEPKPLGTVYLAWSSPQSQPIVENLYSSLPQRFLSSSDERPQSILRRQQLRDLIAKKILYKIYKTLKPNV